MKLTRSDISYPSCGDPIIEAETERLLSGRTRDIRLTGEMLRLYQATSWPQRSKIVRAWAIWVTVINFAFIPISYVLKPEVFLISLGIGIVVIPAAHAGLYLVWSKPRPAWVEGLSVVCIIALFIYVFGNIGAAAHGANAERFLNASMYVTTIAIVVLDVGLVWSAALGVCQTMFYFGFQYANPEIDIRTAMATTLYYCIGMMAVVVARRTALILSQKSFLMSQRDQYRRKELTRANALLVTLATRDPLTGLANRRFTSERMIEIWHDPAIAKTRVALIMMDIDHFKKLNDTAGHAAGDDCISHVARSIEASVRTGDVVCRYGGEEFLIVLTDVTPDTAWTLAERIRSDVEALGIVNPGLPNGSCVTISLGVAFADPGASSEIVAKWADDSLYDAKRSGRNRTFMARLGSLDAADKMAAALPTVPLPV